MMKNISMLLVGIVLWGNVFWAPSCWGQATNNKPLIVVSIPPQKQIVERLIGDRVEILVLISPLANPHAYEPTMAQAKAINRAEIYLQIGHPDLFFENTLVAKFVANFALKTVKTMNGVAVVEDDPHVWTSPRAMTVIARNTAQALMEKWPKWTQIIAANLIPLERDIQQLDDNCRRLFDPHRGESFFVFHPAWGYFAADYGLKQIAIEEHGHEGGTHHAAELSSQAKLAGAKVLFIQPQTSLSAAEILAQELGIKVQVLNPLDEDWFGSIWQSAQKIDAAL